MTHKNHDDDRLDLESPLGLTDAPITKTEADHVEGSSDSLKRRRRARALGEDGIERDHTGSDVNVDPDGAAGIDMGYGGEGTDVGRRR
jgi:hypothetical protein